MAHCKGKRLKETCWLVFHCSQNVIQSFDCSLRDLHDDDIFSFSVHGLFSADALCIRWLIQETTLSNIFICQCHRLAPLGGSVDVIFPNVVLMFTLSYHSLSTADVVTEQVFYMYEMPWFCLSVLGVITYQYILLCEMVYFILYINFYFVLKAPQRRTLHSTTKLMCVRTRIDSLLLCTI